jgi:hypothetical protein
VSICNPRFVVGLRIFEEKRKGTTGIDRGDNALRGDLRCVEASQEVRQLLTKTNAPVSKIYELSRARGQHESIHANQHHKLLQRKTPQIISSELDFLHSLIAFTTRAQ